MAIILEGVQNVMNKFSELMNNIGDQTEESMNEIVIDIGSRAAEKAPVGKSGNLHGSMETEVKTEGDEVVGEIRFTEEYAAAQHEHVEYVHPQHGEAKYLEKAALEKLEQIRENLGAKLNELFGGS